MKLTTKQDIEAPLDFAYSYLSDFDQFERLAARKGAKVTRSGPAQGNGQAWDIRFKFKGKMRQVKLTLLKAERDAVLSFSLESPMFEGISQIDLVRLGPGQTRMVAALDFRPKTLTARLFIQSMKLARGRVQRKLDKGGAKLARAIADQWRAVS